PRRHPRGLRGRGSPDARHQPARRRRHRPGLRAQLLRAVRQPPRRVRARRRRAPGRRPAPGDAHDGRARRRGPRRRPRARADRPHRRPRHDRRRARRGGPMSWSGIAETFQATVLSGSLLAAVPVALVAGAVSFASPCVLPLIPGYVGYLGGMSGTLGTPQGRTGGGTATATRTSTGQGRLLLGVLLFVLGFSAVFVLLGVVFGALGVALASWLDTITRVLGVVVILMGLAF